MEHYVPQLHPGRGQLSPWQVESPLAGLQQPSPDNTELDQHLEDPFLALPHPVNPKNCLS